LDTLKHLFRGDRELFEKLWIGSADFDWRQHPVIDLDLAYTGPSQADGLTFRQFLTRQVQSLALGHDLRVSGENPCLALESLISKLNAKHNQRVVVLLDNYDLPLTAQYPQKEPCQKNGKILSQFLAKLWSSRFKVRFVLIAGQYRFPDRSLYPAVPRPFDLSFNSFFSTLCGVTAHELDKNCYEHMEAATKQLKESGRFAWGKNVYDFREALMCCHNGYSFDGKTMVLNPHSLMRALKFPRFGDGTYSMELPESQASLVEENGLAFDLLCGDQYVTRKENAITLTTRPVLPCLLQSGFLTVNAIAAVGNETRLFLRVPTNEIRAKLFFSLLADGRDPETKKVLPERLATVHRTLKSLSLPAIETAFRRLAASLRKPMYVSERDYFHNDLYLAFRALFQPLGHGDPLQDGVIDGAIDYPGGNVFILQLRSADREWVALDGEPFAYGENNQITVAPPWSLPKEPRPLEVTEDNDPFWPELNVFLDLQAQKAINEIEAHLYPELFFPHVSVSTRVFKVGVAIYQRLKVRVVIDEARRPPHIKAPW
jgi:hypothetical protein